MLTFCLAAIIFEHMNNVDEFYRKVGARVKIARKGKMTQHELGSAVGLSRTSVTNLEKGRQRIPLHILVHIAKLLEVSVDSLIAEQAKAESVESLIGSLPSSDKKWIKAVMKEARK